MIIKGCPIKSSRLTISPVEASRSNGSPRDHGGGVADGDPVLVLVLAPYIQDHEVVLFPRHEMLFGNYRVYGYLVSRSHGRGELAFQRPHEPTGRIGPVGYYLSHERQCHHAVGDGRAFSE